MNYLVDLNLKAAFNVAQLVVKKMFKKKKKNQKKVISNLKELKKNELHQKKLQEELELLTPCRMSDE